MKNTHNSPGKIIIYGNRSNQESGILFYNSNTHTRTKSEEMSVTERGYNLPVSAATSMSGSCVSGLRLLERA